MKLRTKKNMLVVIGLAMFAAGCVLLGLGDIEVARQAGPNGSSTTSVMSFAAPGLLLVIVGPLLALWGVLRGNVPKWIA